MILELNRIKKEEEINEAEGIQLTCAVVFRGDVKLFGDVIGIIKQHGTLIYRKGTSPNDKLYISNSKPVVNNSDGESL